MYFVTDFISSSITKEIPFQFHLGHIKNVSGDAMCLCVMCFLTDKQSPHVKYSNTALTKLSPVVLRNQTRFSGSVLCQRLETPKDVASFSFVSSFTAGNAVKFHLDSVSNSFHIMLCRFKCTRGNNRNLNTISLSCQWRIITVQPRKWLISRGI